ncbi:MAG: hypothetical protein ACKVT0_14630 [Planctomycetaceae bacterium]
MYAEIWKQSEEKLYNAAIRAIKNFCKEEPNTEVRCFFFDSDDVEYGRVGISIDSAANNFETSIDSITSAKKSRRSNLKGKITWQWAKYKLNCPPLEPFNTDSGDFDFGEFAEVIVPEWRKIAKKKDLPNSDDEDENYLEGNARLTMWRTLERLIKEHAFREMKTGSPFIVGFSLHDESPTTIDILNWPK